MKKLSEQLREAIESSEASRYRIAQVTGIDQATLSRFVNGSGTLSQDAADKIAEFLGLTLTVRGNTTAKKKATKRSK